MSTLASVIQEGLDASKPTASIAGRLYFTTDTNKIYYDTGSAWVAVGPSGTSNATEIQSIAVSATAPTTGQVLEYNGTEYVPSTLIPSANATEIQGVAVSATSPTTGQILEYNGTDWMPTTPGAGSGTVTSVAVTVPSRQSVSGSPITSSGTLAITDNTQSANEVFAGPVSGSAAAPGFRAIVAADLPVATGSSLGAVQPDGTSITISSGVISAVGGGAGSNISFGIGNPNTSGGTATPAFIQQADSGSTTVTLGSSVIEGDLIVVAVDVSPDPGSGSVTLSDSLGTSYTQILGQGNGDNHALYVFAGRTTVGGSNTITCASGDTKSMIAAEFSGVIDTVDVSASNSPGGYSGPTSVGVTTTVNGDLIFAAISGAFGGGTITPGSGFTGLTTESGSVTTGAAYALQATAGAISTTFSSSSNYWAQAMVALKANPNGPLPGTDKDIYFDTTSSTYAGYVYHNSYWNPF